MLSPSMLCHPLSPRHGNEQLSEPLLDASSGNSLVLPLTRVEKRPCPTDPNLRDYSVFRCCWLFTREQLVLDQQPFQPDITTVLR